MHYLWASESGAEALQPPHPREHLWGILHSAPPRVDQLQRNECEKRCCMQSVLLAQAGRTFKAAGAEEEEVHMHAHFVSPFLFLSIGKLSGYRITFVGFIHSNTFRGSGAS